MGESYSYLYPSMINGELVIEWKKEKSIQCEDFDEDTGEKEYTMLWKQKYKSEVGGYTHENCNH